MTTKEALRYLEAEQHQVIKEVIGGFKVLISFNHEIDARQYIANLEDKESKYMIFSMIVKDIIIL